MSLHVCVRAHACVRVCMCVCVGGGGGVRVCVYHRTLSEKVTIFTLLGVRANTVLPGAEEHGVQHCSLALFLIFSISADLRSYLRSIGSHESSVMYKVCTQNAL